MKNAIFSSVHFKSKNSKMINYHKTENIEFSKMSNCESLQIFFLSKKDILQCRNAL